MPELEHELRRLSSDVAFPAAPDLVGGLAERLRAQETSRRRVRPAVLGFVALVVAATAALLIPPARSAILDFLRIGGATIERSATQPTAPSDADLALGDRVELSEAERVTDFDVRVPPVGTGIYLDRSIPGGKVSFLWRRAGRRLLVSEFSGDQLAFVGKTVGPRSRIEYVRVGDAEGVWLAGEPHELLWRDEHGRVKIDTRRLVGSVLLWDADGVTYRLEGARTRGEALAIARALR